ncbi:hypothetical protein BRADI_4g03863v3 [Brachypodium distachyon]|uniref:Uncharacterized protein n=1 Tax=Brachypodium distachyon TaxID=15368 RepID=A0A2K2CKA3_BRADI|nr:hypothetical protein BRADI_4g03863v3 [Brachypodium distachyon]
MSLMPRIICKIHSKLDTSHMVVLYMRNPSLTLNSSELECSCLFQPDDASC